MSYEDPDVFTTDEELAAVVEAARGLQDTDGNPVATESMPGDAVAAVVVDRHVIDVLEKILNELQQIRMYLEG